MPQEAKCASHTRGCLSLSEQACHAAYGRCRDTKGRRSEVNRACGSGFRAGSFRFSGAPREIVPCGRMASAGMSRGGNANSAHSMGRGHDRSLHVGHAERPKSLHPPGGARPSLRGPSDRHRQERPVHAGIPGDQPEQQDPGDRRPRQRPLADGIRRDPDLSRRQDRKASCPRPASRATASSNG